MVPWRIVTAGGSVSESCLSRVSNLTVLPASLLSRLAAVETMYMLWTYLTKIDHRAACGKPGC